jgi:uncharacterized coiled-coil DUF342 family protein
MEAMRQSWTDDRLDDLQSTVNEFRAETKAGFAAVHGEFADVRKEMHAEFGNVREEMRAEFAAVRKEMADEFGRVHDEFAAVRKEMAEEFKAVRLEMKEGFEGIQKLMIRFMGIVVVALFGLVGSLIGVVAAALL